MPRLVGWTPFMCDGCEKVDARGDVDSPSGWVREVARPLGAEGELRCFCWSCAREIEKWQEQIAEHLRDTMPKALRTGVHPSMDYLFWALRQESFTGAGYKEAAPEEG